MGFNFMSIFVYLYKDCALKLIHFLERKSVVRAETNINNNVLIGSGKIFGIPPRKIQRKTTGNLVRTNQKLQSVQSFLALSEVVKKFTVIRLCSVISFNNLILFGKNQ